MPIASVSSRTDSAPIGAASSPLPHAWGARSPSGLSAEVAACSSLEQLATLYASSSGRMDAWHLAAMIGRLPKASELHYRARHQLPDSYLELADELVERVGRQLDR